MELSLENKSSIKWKYLDPSRKLRISHDLIFLSVSDYPDQARFSWSLYLEETGSKAVPAEAFKVVSLADERSVWI